LTNFFENWKQSDSPNHSNQPATPETGLSFVGIVTDIAKTGSTFIPGRVGIAASALVYGVAEIDPKASITTQVAEAVTGAVKGVVMHEFVHRLPVKSPAIKGISLGFANRVDETALSYHTYFDQNGKFSASQTAENFKQLAAPKALAADVAIGALAFGAARGVAPILGESLAKSPIARNMVTGGLAGMTAGGANEILRESNSADGIQPWQVAKSTFIAGAIGSVGAASGFYAGRVNFASESKLGNFAPTAANTTERFKFTDATPLSISPTNTSTTDSRFAELPGNPRYAAALSEKPPIFQRDQLELSIAVGDSTKPLQSQHEFAASNIIRADRPVRIYETPNGKGGIHQIVVPEEYATQLDEVRNLHLTANGSDATAAAAARDSLAQNPFRNRTLPEHAQLALQRLPDSGANTRVTLLDEANPMDPWYRTQYKNPNFVSAASTDSHGNVSLYRSEWGSRVFDNVNHEWAHGLPKNQPFVAQLHQTAVRFENGPVSDSYAKEVGERLPVHIEDLLSKDGDYAVMAGRERPIETSILARGLAKTMAETNTPGSINSELQSRLNDIRTTFEPEARAKLAEGLNSDDASVRADAAKLLLHLDGHTELAKMQKPVSLSFAGETLTTEQMRTLGSMPIENLDLSNADLPRWSMTDWRVMPEIKSLNVEGAKNFGNFEVASTIPATPNLENLNIARTAVGDASVEELAAGTKLKSLDVRGTRITSNGLTALRQYLPDTNIVHN
jgi:hypothetical protein